MLCLCCQRLCSHLEAILKHLSTLPRIFLDWVTPSNPNYGPERLERSESPKDRRPFLASIVKSDQNNDPLAPLGHFLGILLSLLSFTFFSPSGISPNTFFSPFFHEYLSPNFNFFHMVFFANPIACSNAGSSPMLSRLLAARVAKRRRPRRKAATI